VSLGPLNRPDPLQERNLVEGKYQNFGNETRLLHKYFVYDKPSALLVGLRYYQGNTHNVQGLASASDDADLGSIMLEMQSSRIILFQTETFPCL